MSDLFTVAVDGCELAAERWPGGDPLVVLLHEGVADRRSWHELAGYLAPECTLVAYDRRGYGQTPPSAKPFSHVDDLLAVLDQVADSPAWLVGASAGGGLALDTALTAPETVVGLVLLGSAVSGAPDPELDAATQQLDTLIGQAIASRDLEEVNRLETHIWLDGPAEPEGRVTGSARSLALDMNAIIVRNGVPEDVGDSDVDAWNRLEEVQVPVTVACGGLDVPFLIDQNREMAERLPHARYQVLPGMAHQPYLEQPETVAQLVRGAIQGRNQRR
jgi:pimeloyl-ACP methyl ester carboxylesterase